MKLNVDLYRINKAPLIEYFKREGLKQVSFFCACSGLPMVAAYCYILEEYPDNTEIPPLIKQLSEFYKYDEILGVNHELFRKT